MIEPVGGVVDELLAALDALAAEDLSPLFDPALLQRLRPLLAAQNRLAAEIARTVREAEVSGTARSTGSRPWPPGCAGTPTCPRPRPRGCCAPGGRWRTCRA